MKKKTKKKKTTKRVTKKTAKKTSKKVTKKAARKTAKKVTKKAARKTAKKATRRPVGEGPKKKRSSTFKGSYSLVVVESPSKAKTINKYLGRNFKVVASGGHIKDLPKSKLGVDIKNNFQTDIVPISGKKEKVDRIRQLAKDAGNIYLAPDMDREGEAIAYHLAEEIGGSRKRIHRVIFNAITKGAVQDGMSNPTALNREMYDSQRTRRIIDRLVGYKISPILWDKVQRGISAGRVQSVALRLIVEREEEIKVFVPEQWFSIEGEMTKDGVSFPVRYHGEALGKKTNLTDEALADRILREVKGKTFRVVDVKNREQRQHPTPPFTTSKLQQEAANKLGFTAKRTMMAAQRLYEGVSLSGRGMQGLITYMRTDSVRTAPEAIEEVRRYIEGRYGKAYLPATPVGHSRKKNTSKVQDAHEAIRPTDISLTPDEVRGDLDGDQQKLYELIWNKFVASQMRPAVIDQTSVSFECRKHFFRANGAVIKFPGFRALYLEALAEKRSRRGEDDGHTAQRGLLPTLKVAESLKCTKGPSKVEHWTTPPPRFNEASLVKDLEERGIGRPSTYASIISNIQDRGYVEKAENRFMPTELGSVVCKMLIEHFPDVMNVNLTADIEELLDKIEEGTAKWNVVLKNFWKGLEKALEKAKEEMKSLKKQLIPTGLKCKKCKKGEYIIKWGKNGQFLSCSHYPDCNSTQNFKRDAEDNIHILPKTWFDRPCPTCNKRLEVKTGRYGKFVRCEDFPQCDTTLPYTLPILCPKCKKGNFAERKSRYGKFFYGCTSYPDCDHALWSRPFDFGCKSCGHPIMIERNTKREGQQLQCPECKHKENWEDTPFGRATEPLTRAHYS